jgi:hypothetical protein
MELLAVITARIFAFVEPIDLNPRGKIYYPTLVAALVDRYGFAKYPLKPEEFDELKGVTFENGRTGEVTVNKVQIFNQGIVVETASSTKDSEMVLEDALIWASQTMGMSYKPGMITRKAFVSNLTFYSQLNLGALNVALSKLADRISMRVPEFYGQPVKYEPTVFYLGYDPTKVKLTPSVFSIERRAEAPFSQNKYYSQAPLPTDEHISALESFEADLLAQA